MSDSISAAREGDLQRENTELRAYLKAFCRATIEPDDNGRDVGVHEANPTIVWSFRHEDEVNVCGGRYITGGQVRRAMELVGFDNLKIEPASRTIADDLAETADLRRQVLKLRGDVRAYEKTMEAIASTPATDGARAGVPDETKAAACPVCSSTDTNNGAVQIGWNGSAFDGVEIRCNRCGYAFDEQVVAEADPRPQAGGAPGGTDRRRTGGIYIASKTAHAARWRQLRTDGVPIISTWIDEAGVGETACFTDLWRRCVDEAKSAAAVVLYREPGEVLKGAFVEAGAALAVGVPVFAVGCEEFSVSHHAGLTRCATLDDALALAAITRPAADPGAQAGARKAVGLPAEPGRDGDAAWFLRNLVHYRNDCSFEDDDRAKVQRLIDAALSATPAPAATGAGAKNREEISIGDFGLVLSEALRVFALAVEETPQPNPPTVESFSPRYDAIRLACQTIVAAAQRIRPAPAATGDAGADRVRIELPDGDWAMTIAARVLLSAASGRDHVYEVAAELRRAESIGYTIGFGAAAKAQAAPSRQGDRARQPIRALVALVEELCDAVDAEGADVGGCRGSLAILREIGPALTPAKNALAAQATPPAPSAAPVPAGQGDAASAVKVRSTDEAVADTARRAAEQVAWLRPIQDKVAPQGDGASAAIRDVLAERRRQVEAEGWTPEHDDDHAAGSLAAAAATYSFGAAVHGRYLSADPIGFWPWDAPSYKPTTPRRDLVKAGALILAEIERLDRIAPPAPSNAGGAV